MSFSLAWKSWGLRLNAKNGVLSPLQRTTYLGVVWDSTMMAWGMIVSCSFRVDPHDSQEGERRPVTQCQAVSGLLGLMAAASNAVTFSLLYMRPLQWWLKTKGFSLRGNPQCKLRDRHVLVRTGNTAVVSYINHQGGLRSHPLYRLAHQILGWSHLAENSSYSWASEYGRRHPVEAGAEARGMEASPRGGEADLESLARLRWICLRLERHGIVPSGSLWQIQSQIVFYWFVSETGLVCLISVSAAQTDFFIGILTFKQTSPCCLHIIIPPCFWVILWSDFGQTFEQISDRYLLFFINQNMKIRCSAYSRGGLTENQIEMSNSRKKYNTLQN